MHTITLTTSSPVPLPLQYSGGFSLLEVLVSVIILSFGLLGMVGLQTASLQANRDARLQSVAIEYARDLADMMRNNKDVALDTSSSNHFLGDFTNPLTPVSASYCLNAANATDVATTSTCTSPVATAYAIQVATADAEMTEWLSRVQDDLPGAHVKVCIDSTPYTAAGVPQWACTAGPGAPVVIKIGWTRVGTDRSATGSAALDRATNPSIIVSVTPGNAT